MIVWRERLRDNRGVTAVEFSMVAPVMVLLMMGLGDLGYQIYVKELLTGAIQKAARDSTIRGAASRTAEIDATVVGMMHSVMKQPVASCARSPAAGTYCSSRLAYATFNAVGPERFEDRNGDNLYNAGECYTDVNGNHRWDAQPGRVGQGNANEVTLYSISLTYPRLFPLPALIGAASTQTIAVQTLLKNQPYLTQTTVDAAERLCN
jgi:hypothetical protein